MKTVFSNAMTAHVWAQQNQPFGHSDSMRFEGPRAYSYRALVANIVRDVNGDTVALFTTEEYSKTTARHVSYYRRAWSGPAFMVPNLEPRKAEHQANAVYLEAEYLKERDELMRAPCDSPRVGPTSEAAFQTRAHATLFARSEVVRRYRECFDVPGPACGWQESADAIIARRDRLASDPKRAAKREARAAATAAREAKQARMVFERNKLYVTEWRAGQAHGRISCEQGGAMLRVNGDTVQTSWGADVPVTDVCRALKLYRKVWWQDQPAFDVPADFAESTLGHFKLDRINADGSIKAGCHTIYAAEIQRLAAELGA